jgi:hypothetical protein
MGRPYALSIRSDLDGASLYRQIGPLYAKVGHLPYDRGQIGRARIPLELAASRSAEFRCPLVFV